MTRHGVSTYRYNAINRQLQRAAGDHDRHLHQTWVDRVLDLLDGDNLIAQAAAGMTGDSGLLFECNVAPKVWDDPRVAHRRQQLEQSDIAVELVDHENTIAGKTFRRAQIRVALSAQRQT